ncbi:MAG: hypothetical protein WA484_05170 [Solirubrobacteraceae bacterium]
MSGSPATHTVLNADIEPQTMARLLSLHDLEHGVVVCHPVPPQARDGHLARDVLYALGKHPAAGRWPRSREVTSHAAIWLQAERITDLLLVRADLFAHATLTDLIELGRGAGAQTWLIFDSASAHRAATNRLRARPAARVRITPSTEQPSPPGRTPERARWSTPSPWIARAAATRALTIDPLNALDARMHVAFKNMSSWLSSHRRLLPQATERFLEILTSDASPQYRYARRIGAASALLLHGFAPEIRERPSRRGAMTRDPTDGQAREIRRHSNPASAALNAIARLTGLDAETLAYLTLDQLIQTPHGVLLGDYRLQGAGATALRAHAAYQTGHGRPATAPLFTRRQLAEHDDVVGESDRSLPRRLEVRLAALPDSLDIAFPQPELAPGFGTPAEDTRQDAWLVIRLLRLVPSRALPLARLQNPERDAAQRLVAGHAAKVHEGLLAATEHLRFSHFLADTPGYLASVRRGQW